MDTKERKTMNKWIAIPVITVLAVVVVVTGYFLWQQTNKLGEARTEIATLEGNVSTLGGKLTASEAEVSSLRGRLTAAEAEVSSLRGRLTAAEGEVSSLRGRLTASEAEVLTLQGELTASEATVATLQGRLTASETTVATLQGRLTASEATVATLQASLRTANAEVSALRASVSTQQALNLALTTELKKVQDPRHFASIQELTDWLGRDDTDIAYFWKTSAQLAYILQVRALRDGYLLSAFTFNDGWDGLAIALIGDELWYIYPADDDTVFAEYTKPQPSHPLPLD